MSLNPRLNRCAIHGCYGISSQPRICATCAQVADAIIQCRRCSQPNTGRMRVQVLTHPDGSFLRTQMAGWLCDQHWQRTLAYDNGDGVTRRDYYDPTASR